jgi:hypothetical protein
MMPFHIDYSGPSPISTYFRVKPAPATVGQPEPTDATLKNAPDQVETDTSPEPNASQIPPNGSIPVNEGGNATKRRFISAFRGRTVQGLEVALPEGYGGVVLRGAVERDGSRVQKDKTGVARAGQRGGRSRGRETQAEDSDQDAHEETGAVARTLNASETFSSLVLWNADNPVDESRDEYVRALTEWTRLAGEVRFAFRR